MKMPDDYCIIIHCPILIVERYVIVTVLVYKLSTKYYNVNSLLHICAHLYSSDILKSLFVASTSSHFNVANTNLSVSIMK